MTSSGPWSLRCLWGRAPRAAIAVGSTPAREKLAHGGHRIDILYRTLHLSCNPRETVTINAFSKLKKILR